MRGHLFAWVPVGMAIGIALWLGWPGDPGPVAWAGMAAVGIAGGLLWWRGPEGLQPVGAACVCLVAGYLLAEARSIRVEGQVLGFRYYGPVEGRVVGIDRSQSDKMRVTLDQVALDDVRREKVPRRVRISLHGAGDPTLLPGQRVAMTAHLAAPDGPVEPGGFDFQRMAWFRSLGAVGYTRTPVMLVAHPPDGSVPVTRLRMRISAAVQAALPGEPGAFAAAILTGDRSGIGQDTLQALRDSNLAHLLAISGLHMGLLTGFVFAALRLGLALVPYVALRWPTRKLAAVVALGAAAFYLALSGGNVATERAFIMVSVMLGAVLADRRALSLHSVALAAVVILALQPESLVEPGFQMSFAATAVLVAGFASLQGRLSPRRLPGWLRPLVVLVVSSGLAGLATAPIAAAHFNRIAEYGLLANILAVPLMGTVVIPGAVIAAVLAPLGLAAPALWAMEQGTRWILAVAHGVAGLEGAVVPVLAPAGFVLPVLGLAGVWLVAVPGRWRLVAAVPLVVVIWTWPGGGRPDLLISADAGLLGLMGPDGRALSGERGNGFAAEVWLENDGDRATQPEAAARSGFSGTKGALRFSLGPWEGAHLAGKGAEARLTEACAQVRLVILAAEAPAAARPGCAVIDRRILARTGPIALRLARDGSLVVQTTRAGSLRRWQTARPSAEGSAEPALDQVLAMLALQASSGSGYGALAQDRHPEARGVLSGQ